MDDRTKESVEKESAQIRHDMRGTRAALTDKLDNLEDRVTERVENIQHRVEASVDKVKNTVHDTMQTVKDAVDWRHQMNEHPWAMFGGAVLAGFVVSRFVGSGEARSLVRAGLATVSMRNMHGDPSNNPPAGDGGAPTLLNRAMGGLNAQVDRLEHAAISAAGEIVERLVTRAIPGLAGHLHRFNGKGS